MANLGYIQVVRHCNHNCVFCSNPESSVSHGFETFCRQIDGLKHRGYYGVILTGGEPTLHPDLPRIAAYARDAGLHVRLITNGWNMAEGELVEELARAGVQLVHVSVYSVRPTIEARLRGVRGSLDRAFSAIDSCLSHGIDVNVNCVINRLNADHLDENISHFLRHHPRVRHFVWNNLDPSMGRAEVNRAHFTPRLADFEISLWRALSMLHRTGRTFRVEKVPLCYMTDFAWASTETRKIVKGEERIVHFLDEKDTVRQTDWEHLYADACKVCSLRTICGGLFDRGAGYDPAELHPVFVPIDPIVDRIIRDEDDPSYPLRVLQDWKSDFARRLEEARQSQEERAAGDQP
ncbi:MAG: radical SAM protein [Myxococcota bacterium]